jgi:hypothetical protein
MLPFLFRKRIEHLGKTEEDGLLDLEIRRAMQAEYGSAEPPAGIFDRVMYSIKQRQRRNEAAAHRYILAFVLSITRTLYAQTRKVIALAAINRLAPAGVALALLLVFSDANVQHMLGRNTSLPSAYHSMQGTPLPIGTAESRSNVADLVVEPDPSLVPGSRSRGTLSANRTKNVVRESGYDTEKTTGLEKTNKQETHSEEELYLNYGRPY